MTHVWISWRLGLLLGSVALVALAILLLGESVRGSPDATVRMGSGFVLPGDSITLDLDALDVASPDGPLGAFTIEVEYNPALLDATACTPDPDGTFDFGNCSPDYAPGVARCTGVSISGVSGAQLTLCDITFQAGASVSPGTVTPLPVNCTVLTDPGGSPIACTPQAGEITIGENIPPVCNDTSASTPQDTPATFPLPCSDPDQGPELLTCDVVTPPSHGGAVVTDCSATYTPDAGFTGQDCFTYEAFDGQDSSSPPNQACIDVTPDQVEPVVVRMGSGTVPPGGSITLDLDALDVPPGSLGAFTIDVEYDPALFDATVCTPDPGGIFDAANCNPDYAANIARCTGVSSSGVSGLELTLCDITFQQVPPASVPPPIVSPLPVNCVVLADPSGSSIDCTPQNGEIEIIDGPHVIVRVGHGMGAPGGTATVPLEVLGVTDPPRLGAATIDVEYDPTYLDAIDCDADPGGVFDSAICNATYDNDNVDPDSARSAVLSAAGVSGDILIYNVTFDVGQCTPGSIIPVTPAVVTLADPSGAPISYDVELGTITCGLLGDVDCDGDVDGVDSLFVLQYVVGMRDGSDQCPPPLGTLNLTLADVDEDGDVDGVDSLFILQCVVGMSPGAGMPFCLEAP